MEYITLTRDGIYGKRGDQVQVTIEEAKRMVENGFASRPEPKTKRGTRKTIEDKSLSKAG